MRRLLHAFDGDDPAQGEEEGWQGGQNEQANESRANTGRVDRQVEKCWSFDLFYSENDRNNNELLRSSLYLDNFPPTCIFRWQRL
jgi:hypothetical protein